MMLAHRFELLTVVYCIIVESILWLSWQKLSVWVILFDWIFFRFDRRYCHFTRDLCIHCTLSLLVFSLHLSHFSTYSSLSPFTVPLNLFLLAHAAVNNILVALKSRCHTTRRAKSKTHNARTGWKKFA